MFKLFGKKTPKQRFDFSAVHTDMHSHLLPGIDDGSPDLDTSIELIREMHALGYKKLITTPHVMWDMYRNTTGTIQAKRDEVNSELQKQGVDFTIQAAAEYFLDEHVEDLLRKKEPLLTIKDNMVLCEFSLAFPALNIKSVLFEMQMQGYQPIIAHPERYIYLDKNKEFYDELRDLGCLFQLNILSLGGHYGRSVTDLAHYLLKNGFYNLIGTDLHHSGHLDGLQRIEVPEILSRMLASGQILNPQL